MAENDLEVALLIADITGSTPLYEDVGNAGALALVGECLDALRSIARNEGGMFIRSKGDDVLCAFTDPSSALRAARQMLSQQLTGPLGLHVGINFGHIIHARGDVFGDAVNLTARLSALANPGEVLASKSFVDRLPEAEARSLRVLDNITFKGKGSPTKVYSLMEGGALPRTEIAFGDASELTGSQHEQAAPEVSLTIQHGGRLHSCGEGASLSIGRSARCDVVIAQSWVSRQHLTVTVRRRKVQLVDQSSSGTYISTHDGYEFFMRRESVLLTGSGTISPAMPPTARQAEVIPYEVVRH